jgi:glycosyltransferase involved in cell wall biosynthesis
MNDCSAPELSVAVCTWNPRQGVEETLDSLRCQTLERSRYEVLVVDNASAEAVAADLRRMCAAGGLRYVREEQAGLSHARNRAVSEARSRHIFFIDDDAVAPAHLLERILGCFASSGADVVGGPAHGAWDVTPPAWLSSEYWRMLSLVSYGETARELVYPEILLGCNIAFRCDVFDDVGNFRTELGRTADGLLGGEERAIQRDLMQRGRRVFYDPRAYVFHRVGTERMAMETLAARYSAATTSHFVMERSTPAVALLAPRFAYRMVRNLGRAARRAWRNFVFEQHLERAILRGTLAARRPGVAVPSPTDGRDA